MQKFLYPVFILLVSCSIKQGNTNNAGITVIPAADTVPAKATSKPSVANTLKVIRYAYVIAHNGAKAYTKDWGEKGWCYPFMQKLPVVYEHDSIVGVTDSYDTEIVYIKKRNVGSELDISLTDTDLNQPYVQTDYPVPRMPYENCGVPGSGEEAFTPGDYPDIEVTSVTKEQFLKIKKTSVEHFTANEAVKKVNGITAIGPERFTDSLGEGDLPNTWTYMGEFKALNAVLLQYTCEACEEYSYVLINKKTGKEIATFSNIPIFSADLKYIMDAGQLYSDSPTLLYCSTWKHNTEEPYAHKEFSNWAPVGSGFWGKDNCFYTTAIPSVTKEDYNRDSEMRNRENYNFRYLKIKVKAKTLLAKEE